MEVSPQRVIGSRRRRSLATSAMNSAKATAAATVAVASLPLPVKSPSRCPSSRGISFKTVAIVSCRCRESSVKKPLIRDVSSRLYPSGVWRI